MYIGITFYQDNSIVDKFNILKLNGSFIPFLQSNVIVPFIRQV